MNSFQKGLSVLNSENLGKRTFFLLENTTVIFFSLNPQVVECWKVRLDGLIWEYVVSE